MIKQFLQFYFRAQTRYNVHSPFVSDFIKHVFEDNRHYYAFDFLGKYRERLIQNQPTNTKTIYSERHLKLLFKITTHYRPESIIEVGSSVGLSSLYLHFAAVKTPIHLLENDLTKTSVITKGFEVFNAQSIQLHNDSSYLALQRVIDLNGMVDLLIIDGNDKHLFQTFKHILPKCQSSSILIINHIHKSQETELVWKKIIKNNQVRLSLDLFDMGIVFFREEQLTKEHFNLIYYRYKPFNIGIFS